MINFFHGCEGLITQLTINKLSGIKPNFAELGWQYGFDWRTVKKYYDRYSGKPSHRNKPSKLDKLNNLNKGEESNGLFTIVLIE